MLSELAAFKDLGGSFSSVSTIVLLVLLYLFISTILSYVTTYSAEIAKRHANALSNNKFVVLFKSIKDTFLDFVKNFNFIEIICPKRLRIIVTLVGILGVILVTSLVYPAGTVVAPIQGESSSDIDRSVGLSLSESESVSPVADVSANESVEKLVSSGDDSSFLETDVIDDNKELEGVSSISYSEDSSDAGQLPEPEYSYLEYDMISGDSDGYKFFDKMYDIGRNFSFCDYVPSSGIVFYENGVVYISCSGKYERISFCIAHVEGSGSYDGKISAEILKRNSEGYTSADISLADNTVFSGKLNHEMIPEEVSINIDRASVLKIEVTLDEGWYYESYGIYDIKLYPSA